MSHGISPPPPFFSWLDFRPSRRRSPQARRAVEAPGGGAAGAAEATT